MKQTLRELVDVILQKMDELPGALPSENGIRHWLVRQGYAKRDIDAAMKLVGRRVAQPRLSTGPGLHRVRHLSNHEQYKLTMDARNALARLDLYEMIDSAEREMILERLDHFEGEIGLSELDYLVSWVVSSSRDYESQQTLYSVLEGKKESHH